MTATATAARPMLSDEMLKAFASRASGYDQANSFFTQDFEDLRAAGYLKMLLPQEFGGQGATLVDYTAVLRRLAYHAPATALATNMHQYWCGVASSMRKMGDNSLDWILREAADGEVFAAAHGEAGAELPLFLSTTRAERVEGGYRFTGHKIFTSLTPVWTRLAIHGMTADGQIVHAFMPRDTPGYTIKETWDTLGMRATRSDDTILDGAFIPDKYIARKLPAGTPDLFVLSVFAWAEPTFASVYVGIAQRAIDLAVAGVKKRSSLALSRSMAYHPEVQHEIAAMQIEFEGIAAHVDRIASDWTNGADFGHMWPMKLVAMKHHCVEGAKQIVDRALTVSGGTGMFKSNELERLYRDVRCGGFHPANSMFVHELVGKSMLGIDLGEQPRWG
ncbi:MAG: acyl-CoA dehydrogenase family protein [Tepidiformaceae bacterium]